MTKSDFYKNVLLEAPFGYAYYKLLYDENNQPSDFELIDANNEYKLLIDPNNNYETIIGKKLTELTPVTKNYTSRLELLYKIAQTGITNESIEHSPLYNRWFKVKDVSLEKNYILSYFIEMTDSFKVQQAALNKFHKIFNTNPTLMSLTDTKTRKFIDINKEFCRITGYEKEEVLGKSSSELNLFVDPEIINKAIVNIQKNKHSSVIEAEVRKKNGSILNGLFYCETIENNNEVSYLTVMVNITEIKKNEHLLKKAKLVAESANFMKSRFLANISHEIRTPLNAIIGFLELLIRKSSNLNANDKSYLEKAKNSSLVLLDLINNILNLSKIEAGKITLDKSTFNLIELANEIISSFSAITLKKNLKLNLHIDPNVPTLINSDQLKIKQILNNLISNAIKFTHQGEIDICIVSNSFIDDLIELVFRIKDTGIGIQAKDLHKIFDAFIQIDSSITRNYDGSGLGLAITKEFVNMLDGSISVESEYEKGSTFTVLIKAKAINVNKSVNLDHKLFNNINVLIINNNTPDLKIILDYFQAKDCSTFESNSTSNALITLIKNSTSAQKINLIIADFTDNKKEGEHFIRTLESLPMTKELMLIILTTKEHVDKLNEINTRPFIKYFQTPINFNHFIEYLSQSPIYNLPNLSNQVEENLNKRYLQEKTTSVNQIPLSQVNTPKILLVEDNDINRKVFLEFLKQINLKCDHAENGEQALKILSNEIYDIIFMDINMPIMDGYATTKAIRKLNSPNKNAYIVAITANIYKDELDKCLFVGMNNYISKPINSEKIYEIIYEKAGIK